MIEIIKAYQTLFPFRHETTTMTSLEQLEVSIQIELLDELTHPRIRKSSAEKLQIAYERIEKSNLNNILKMQLKQVYGDVFKTVNTF